MSASASRAAFTRAGLKFYARTHLGILAGAALTTAILVGALVVGASVKTSLRELALVRLGKVGRVLLASDRYVREELAIEMETELGATVAPLLQTRALLKYGEPQQVLPRVELWGADFRFWQLAPDSESPAPKLEDDQVLINEALARRLKAKVGDEVLLRVAKASVLPRDVPLISAEQPSASLRLKIAGVLPDQRYGRFSLRADQASPLNAFMNLDALQTAIERPDRVNLLLVKDGPQTELAALRSALKKRWRPIDVGLRFAPIPGGKGLELRSERIFLDAALSKKAAEIGEDPRPVFSYFVNTIRKGDKTTPYSIAASLDLPKLQLPIAPPALGDNEALVTRWLADDLGLARGDELSVSYYVLDAGRKLVERTQAIKVAGQVPSSVLDPQLMPDFPGLSDKENCREWDSGIPINLDLIRDKDEAYWEKYRGTPKLILSLATGQRLWGNRFGSLTGLRYSVDASKKQAMVDRLVAAVDPEELGLILADVRGPALESARNSVDFGGLFIGLSFFLIAAALLLTSMLFVFGAEQRSREVGLLLAIGWTRKAVLRSLLKEGLVIALAGAMIGVIFGLGYAALVIAGLRSLWIEAVGTTALALHPEPLPLVIGGFAGLVCALGAMAWALRKQFNLAPRDLLDAGPEARANTAALVEPKAGALFRGLVFLGFAAAIGLGIWGIVSGQTAGAFFGAGGLLLLSGLGAARLLLIRLDRPTRPESIDLERLALSGAVRRRGRSLVAIITLASGVFLVTAVGANRKGPPEDPRRRDSGTGGFALVGEATVPIVEDLNIPRGREALSLNDGSLEGVRLVGLKVRDGDDASCLNLNRVQRPRILGARPEELKGRFQITKTIEGLSSEWAALSRAEADGTVPAFADGNMVQWQLGKSLGDIIEYRSENGAPLKLRIAGLMASSVLQGHLIIDRGLFEKAYPSEPGERFFLIDVEESKDPAEVSQGLRRDLEDFGLDLLPAGQKLKAFQAVENTYLAIFQALGALALALGSLGLAILFLRNVMERRGELGLMRAIGYSMRRIDRYLFVEHAFLLVLGFSCGTLAAAASFVPAALRDGAGAPWGSTLGTLGIIAAGGLFWLWAAARLARDRAPLEALRRE